MLDAERAVDTVYTNTNNVPLYVQITVSSKNANARIQLYIDGEYFGQTGQGTSGASIAHTYTSPLYVIPTGSTYEFKSTESASTVKWQEARMPLAIASGGGSGDAQPPVVFRAKQTNSQPIPDGVETKILFDTTEFDSDSYFDTSSNRYIPKKEGYYQFNSNIQLGGTATGQVFMGNIKKNGTNVAVGSNGFSTVNTIGGSSGASCNVYMNGTTDYVEVFAFQKSGAEIGIQTVGFFDGHMVSSITEGEVKEKEAVVISARATINQPATANVYTLIKLDDVEHDTNSSYDTTTGRFTPKVEGYYQVNSSVQAVPTDVSVGTTATSRVIKNGDSLLCYDGSYVRSSSSQQLFNPVAVGSHIIYMNGTTDYLELWGRNSEGTEFLSVHRNTGLSASLITGQSTGGSGGGSYTPEALVWENKLSERAVDTVYTNTNDAPLYVQLYANIDKASSSLNFKIDGVRQAKVGVGDGGVATQFSPLYIIPAGSTYEIVATGTGARILDWHEARMPLAIAVGGASGGGDAQPPVAFEARLSANASVSSDGTWLKCELDDAVTDTNSGVKDGGYTIPKDGIYNISFMHGVSADKNLNKHYAQLYVNGEIADTSVTISQTEIVNGGNHGLSGTTVREFKVGDVVELWYYVKVNTTSLGIQPASVCRLSGHMISSITEGEVKEKEAVVFRAVN